MISPISALNLDNKYRFRIHKRWIFQLNNEGGNSRVLNFYKKFGNDMKIRYDGIVGDISDLTSKSLSLLFISDEPTNTPSITFFNRMRFVDN